MITGELIMQYRPAMYQMAYRIVNDQMRADDITDRAIEKAWVKRDTYDESKAQPITWLCQIAKNEALQNVKREKCLVEIDETLLGADDPDYFQEENTPDYLTEYAKVLEIIKTDPNVHRRPQLAELFVSYYRDELGETLDKIADDLNMEHNTLRTIFKRMRDRVWHGLTVGTDNYRQPGVKQVERYTLDGKLISVHRNPSAAATDIGSLASAGVYIRLCANGLKEQYAGSTWRWAKNVEQPDLAEARRQRTNARRRIVDQLDANTGELIRTWDSPKAATKGLGFKHNNAQYVRECANGKIPSALGYRWKWTLKKS